jgi:hypothetical protein
MNIFKYTITAVAVLFSATAVSFAQHYSIIPNDTIRIIGIMEDEQTLSIQQLNSSTDTITLHWKKISESVPSKWEASVCDNSFCNTSLADSGTMSPIIPADYGLLLLHITPHVTYGTAVVQYVVWDDTTPSIKDTLTYILTVFETMGINEAYNYYSFSIFPNPASDNLHIILPSESNDTFSITDISGTVIQKGTVLESSKFVSIENFPNGIYFILIFDPKKKYTFAKKIIVQH